jgi:hypothetical protein
MRRSLLSSLTFGVVAVIALIAAPGLAAAQSAAQPTPIETAYFADTAPFRANLDRNQQWLEAILTAMTTGHADEVSTDELGNLSRELFNAKQGFARARPSARLDQYDRLTKSSLDRAYTATVLLLHAQVTESGPDHDALVRDAGQYTASSGRLLKDAAAALGETALTVQ